MAESGEQFLHRKDPKLHTTGPLEHEQTRRKRVGEETSQKPADKIAGWLGIIEKTHIGHGDDPRVIERIKDYYHREYVIKPENVPQSYWNLQGEIAVNEGRKQDLISAGVQITEDPKPIYTFPEELKEPATRTVILNQEQSLDRWIDYLTSDDVQYPMWAKYWAFRSVVKMGKFEKMEDGRTRFANREKNTVSSFPVLNPRALANTIGAMSARLEERGKPKNEQKPVKNLSTTLTETDFQNLLSTEDFSKAYAQFLAEIPQYSTHGLEETRGKWVKYDQGGDPKPLVASLEGHPLEWCTADIDTARMQLSGGDFYVYYSVDEDGSPNVPRLAIRMEGSRIAELPRGIAPDQNLDPYISDVLEKKMEEFGSEGQAFKKRAEDMKRLTRVIQKSERRQTLDALDLTFIYELDEPIEGFGYHKDPRVEEVRSKRDPEEDMPIVFGCSKEQIARRARDINENTKAYVGSLEAGIFDKLPANMEHVYTSFPEKRIRREHLSVDSKTKSQEKQKLNDNDIKWQSKDGSYAEDLINNPKFPEQIREQDFDLIILSVGDLGFDKLATTDQVYSKAKELGLELCPSEVGPELRIAYKNQPMGEWIYVGMEPITDRDGNPRVFGLVRHADGLWLYYRWAGPEALGVPAPGLSSVSASLNLKNLVSLTEFSAVEPLAV